MEEKERKSIEKLLSKLAEVQIKARYLWSHKQKGLELDEQTEIVEDIAELSGSFNTIAEKLAKKTGSTSILKTVSKLSQCNENTNLAEGYLNQIARELRDVSKKIGAILNFDKITAQSRAMLKKKEDEKLAKASVLEVSAKNEKPLTSAKVFAFENAHEKSMGYAF